MNRDELLEKVKVQMTEHRFQHTLGVVDTARSLAAKYGADPQKADTAAVVHDYCKFWDKDRMREIILQESTIAKDLLDFDKELWHAPVGAWAAERELGIQDEEILNAVRYHTSGRVNMSLLEKIIWLADYIEPGRHFPGVEEIRELAAVDLDTALAKAMGNTISFLAKQGRRVYPLTVEAYNDMIIKTAQRGKE